MGKQGTVEEFKMEFERISGLGFIKSTRKGPTGIGKTFEDMLDKIEDNEDAPDFGEIEIKAHDTIGNSMVTLFTKAPTNPKQSNTYLRERYGVMDTEFGVKTLHMTVSAIQKTKSEKYDYDFQIRVNRKEKRIIQMVFDKTGTMIDDSVYWTFESLEKQLIKKLGTLGLVDVEVQKKLDGTYYHYVGVQYIKGLTIDNMVKAIEDGAMKIDNRIGAYKTGSKKGKTHDHGTGFRMTQNALLKYGTVFEI
ncbi:MvaI/BcnI restriction endonuclease family protein [Leuconostoc citreum]|uniref:MvaI/BcnI family restriction endonuclease n=1 Tax=Leuconostoc TaxID=1243 RepID=UPI001239DF1F|nr:MULTISPECIES: MvaI/BcnI family restriction endonuclease [Leuconostoc]KAA8373092.1 MvaI/BcnI restriction endonuclease family protein [Leuconostoc carnosum]MCT3073698.1 MvaI/BcnI restriction endonuclease family protein [Leuconostoc citreum]